MLHRELIVRDDPAGTLVSLHGHGSDERAMFHWEALLDPAGRFNLVFPRGPTRTPWGAAWWDFVDDLDAMKAELQQSVAVLGDLVDEFGSVAASPVFLSGFSQGGAIALAVGLGANGVDVAGVLAFASWWPVELGLRVDRTSPRPPVFAANGTQDDRLHIDQFRGGIAALEEAGVDLTVVEHAGGHDVPADAAVAARGWLRDRL